MLLYDIPMSRININMCPSPPPAVILEKFLLVSNLDWAAEDVITQVTLYSLRLHYLHCDLHTQHLRLHYLHCDLHTSICIISTVTSTPPSVLSPL